MTRKIKPWLDRVNVEVISVEGATMRARVRDKGNPAGEMTLTRHPTNGHWHLASPSKVATWSDSDLRAWCKRVGGGMWRTVALVKAAQSAYIAWEIVEISEGRL